MDPALFGELWELLESPDRKVRGAAAHRIEEISALRPELRRPCKDLLLRFMPRVDDWIVRSRCCLMIPRLELSTEERLEAFETLRAWLPEKSSVLRTFAMQAMFDLAMQDSGLLTDVTKILDEAAVKGTKAMKARSRQLMKKLPKVGG